MTLQLVSEKIEVKRHLKIRDERQIRNSVASAPMYMLGKCNGRV